MCEESLGAVFADDGRDDLHAVVHECQDTCIDSLQERHVGTLIVLAVFQIVRLDLAALQGAVLCGSIPGWFGAFAVFRVEVHDGLGFP